MKPVLVDLAKNTSSVTVNSADIGLTLSKPPPLHVVAGLIRDNSGRLLIQQRTSPPHFKGRWEFPGGKVEPQESVVVALARELNEELGLSNIKSAPWMRLLHDYSDHPRTKDQPSQMPRILLDVREVTDYHGEASGREGQHFAWTRIEELSALPFLDANVSIIAALQRGRSRHLQIPGV